MEKGRKRRKLQEEEEEEEEGDDHGEESQMKLFFALIQNSKAMRDRVKSKASAEEEIKSTGIWKPKFQPEDFIEDGYNINNKSNITLQLTAAAAASSSTTKQSNEKKEQQEQEEEDDDEDKFLKGKKGLDLNLSL